MRATNRSLAIPFAALLCLTLATGCGDDGEDEDGNLGEGVCTAEDCDEVPFGPETTIEASAESWTWVDFPDSACGNGAPTGIAVNPTTRSTDLFIYLEGGGACWSNLTCFTVKSATRIETGYTATDFQSDSFPSADAVDRSLPGNPFRDMSYVYVPYCTGDVHAGNAIQNYGAGRPDVHHKGARNMVAFLRRLVPTFPNVTRVFLGGSSAGAYGVQLNYERVVEAFPNAEVHLLADCGQMVNPAGTLLTSLLTSWNAAIDDDCTDCETDFTKFPAYLADKYANRRFGLLAYERDAVLRAFFGYGPADFETQTNALVSQVYEGRANMRYFLVPSEEHVMLDNVLTLSGPGGASLPSFVSGWLSGAPGWVNVHD